MLKLPKELANQFDDFVKEYEENKKVEYVTHIERRGIDKGQAKMVIRLLEEKFEIGRAHV